MSLDCHSIQLMVFYSQKQFCCHYVLATTKLGISDRETVEQIKENPYLQYFLGEKSYRNEAPFDASMMVHFRQRISPTLLQGINQKIVQQGRGFQEEVVSQKNSKEAERKKENRGKLLIDATMAPADIKYPRFFRTCYVKKY